VAHETAAKMIDWWLRDRSTGKVVVVNVPNSAIVVWLVATGVRLLDALPEREEQLRWIGSGVLMVWGADELVRGVNPFRRLAGAVVLGWQILGLLR
jgi:hypothetical protein